MDLSRLFDWDSSKLSLVKASWTEDSHTEPWCVLVLGARLFYGHQKEEKPEGKSLFPGNTTLEQEALGRIVRRRSRPVGGASLLWPPGGEEAEGKSRSPGNTTLEQEALGRVVRRRSRPVGGASLLWPPGGGEAGREVPFPRQHNAGAGGAGARSP
ncbi:hypothetical protein NDU88_006662 [Pleurodeles waltl]|uniref:Uncharacterized protein n=1 Tax=Pleurodeles waltl TaxID=8319 RepID=A0AAV7VNA9_PLEWA|nr:hypothetical protein NDU88_006662 [Pleurodeles waltl]